LLLGEAVDGTSQNTFDGIELTALRESRNLKVNIGEADASSIALYDLAVKILHTPNIKSAYG
jgi:hypothetical protein